MKFEGEHISKSLFAYKAVSKHSNYMEIDNTFNVSKLSDKPIFSVSRFYYIDPHTGRHVDVPGKEKREGYLFAPHYASKRPFYYWHINYDAPALMKFVNQEKINGLTVYHYQATYEADQTANLAYLPGVPQQRGVKTEITLQLWIEPVSGWLIKYFDNTLGYYYDIKTGQRLAPWNSFSNRYTQTSINAKVKEATTLKWKFLFIDFGVPVILILFPLLAFFLITFKTRYPNLYMKISMRYKRHEKIGFTSIIYILCAAATLGSIYYLLWYETPPSIFKVGISQWNNNAELVSAVQGFRDGMTEYGFIEGKNVKYIIENPNSNIENQINIIQAFIRDKVDLIFTLTTPGTLVAKGSTTRIPIVFSDVSYPVESNVVATMQLNNSNLTGTSNYIMPAVQFYKFDAIYPSTKVLGFLHHKGDPESEIQYQGYKTMLARRGIDVIDIPAIDFDDIQNQLQLQLQQHPFNALFVACDTLIRDGGGKIAAEFSNNHKIPSFTCDKDSAMEGVLVAYFDDLYELGKLAGIKAALILSGADPSWLRIESLEHENYIINKNTAHLLGVTIPSDVSSEATFVGSQEKK